MEKQYQPDQLYKLFGIKDQLEQLGQLNETYQYQ